MVAGAARGASGLRERGSPGFPLYYTTRCQGERRNSQGIAGFLWWKVWAVSGLKARNTAAMWWGRAEGAASAVQLPKQLGDCWGSIGGRLCVSGLKARNSTKAGFFATLRMTDRVGGEGAGGRGHARPTERPEDGFGPEGPEQHKGGIPRCAQNDR